MASKKKDAVPKKVPKTGAWTAEEDRKLVQYIELHGAKNWKTVAAKSGLKRCGKSCRLRWLNYLRPDIKRGNISPEEEDLIIRLHKLLGNRWSLIAGRLPGRTDNEIKNFWNCHLSKKIYEEKGAEISKSQENFLQESSAELSQNSEINFDMNEFFDFSHGGPSGVERANNFPELREKVEGISEAQESLIQEEWNIILSRTHEESLMKISENSELSYNNEFFDFRTEGCFDLKWVNKFLELDEDISH